ncbi:MAG: hypothetical protein HZY77_01495 [Thiobacillus sp.]|uniref:hypothetical protein n=1 Tax=Thiobacillus sp. TaxID=924 RepID=UPI00168C520D|nr:hypothetical protein [Thiobacillus sp.]QLQ01738.1 MAG: hypothetical protein HZY77_01495 [Thiobacillus sp.]
MPTKTQILYEQIQELETELENADRAHRTAVNDVAASPSDADARNRAREAATRGADLRGELAVMRQALATAEEEERSEEVQERKREAVAALRRAEALAPKCIKASEAIDEALVNLAKAVRARVEAVDKFKDQVVDFYRLGAGELHNPWDIHMVRSGITDSANNAIACQIEEAVRPLNARQYSMSFNFVRNSPDEPELAARDTARAIDGAIMAAKSAASNRGLPL